MVFEKRRGFQTGKQKIKKSTGFVLESFVVPVWISENLN